MKHINKPKGQRTFLAGLKVYEAHGTSDSVVLVNGVETSPIKAWANLVNSGYTPKTCPHCGRNVDDDPGLIMVGAHVLDINKSENIKHGESCYIIPLCNSCNSTDLPRGFSLRRDVKALQVMF